MMKRRAFLQVLGLPFVSATNADSATTQWLFVKRKYKITGNLFGIIDHFRIVVGEGSAFATNHHQILTSTGFKKVDQIQVGDLISKAHL